MMIKAADQAIINDAANRELTAQYMYRKLANCAQNKGYKGSQKFFLSESLDEGSHYQEIVDFSNDVGKEIELSPVLPMKGDFDTIPKMFEAALDAETELGEFYSEAYEKVSSVMVKEFLLGFVKRQRLAIGEYRDFVATIARCGNDPCAFLLFDNSFLEEN
jgi:ferritin